MIAQAGVPCKQADDSQRFLLDHFDTIKNSPSHIYHSALPLCPSSSWLHKCYHAEFSQEVKVVKGLPAVWGKCSRTVSSDSNIGGLACWNNTIAVGSSDGDVIILDAVTGSQIAAFSGHTGEVYCLAFSSDGGLLASGSLDKTVKLWDMQTGGDVRTFPGHTDWVSSVSISADFVTIASGTMDGMIHLWSIHTGERYCVIKQEGIGGHVRFSPTDPQHLLSADGSKVQQWNRGGYYTGSTYCGYYFAFSPDGTQVAVCSKGSVTVWNSSSGVTVAKLHMKNSAYPRNCSFSPDGKLVAASNRSFIYIWDITSSDPHPIQTFPGGLVYIHTLLFSSPTSLISTQDNLIKFWQIGSPSTDLAETDPGPTSLISAGGQLLTLQAKDGIIITSEGRVLKVWDTSTSLCKASFKIPPRSSSEQHAQLINGRLIFTSWEGELDSLWNTGNQKVYLWDAEEGKLLWKVVVCEFVKDIKISQDGSRIFCLYEESLQSLSAETGEVTDQVEVLSGHYLTVDGLVVWVHHFKSGYQGWNFGISDSSPVQLLDVFPCHYLNGTLQWDPFLCGVKNEATGKVVFWVPEKYGSIFDIQWNEHHLVICFLSKEVLILDFSHIL